MSKVRVCWGKEQWEVERTELSSLQALKELVYKWTRVKPATQTLFYHNRCISTEEEFCDAIESSDPVLYVHSLPPIQVFIKFGWILKSLNVYSFYSIRYIMYLSLDVLESEMNCSLQETDLHLLLKNKMLMNTEATVYDSHIENGDILEIVVSSHSIISKVLQAQARMRNDMEYTVDPQSLLSSRLLFLQLSNGESSLPTQAAMQYLASITSESSVQSTLSALPVSQSLTENAFVVLLQLLLHNYSSTLFIPSSLTQLLSVPLSPIGCESALQERDPDCVISYQNIHDVVSQLSLEEVFHPWALSWDVASRLGITDETLNNLWKSLGLEKGETVSVGQLIVAKKLQSTAIPTPFPSNYWLLMHCSCTK